MNERVVFENGKWWFFDGFNDRIGPFSSNKAAWDAMTDHVGYQDEENELATSGRYEQEWSGGF